MFTKDKAPQTLRQMALAAIEQTGFYPAERPGPAARHDRQPARLVHQPPAQLGRAGAVLPAQGFGRAAPAHDGDPGPGGRHRAGRRHRGLEPGDGRRDPGRRRRAALHQEQRHPGGVVRFGHAPSCMCCAAPMPTTTAAWATTTPAPRPTCTWKATTSTAAGSTAPAAGQLRHPRPGALPRPADPRLHRRQPGPQDEQEPGQRHRAAGDQPEAGRRDHPPVGGRQRLFGRHRRRRQDPGPGGRRLPPHPQHAALPAGQRQRFRRRHRQRGGRTSCWRSTATRWPAPAQFQDEILAHYEVYEFHPVVAKLQVYCSEDLGAFYLDVLKDRLYTTAPKSLARRSAQTALWHITQAMLRWMAPFMSFTAEEAWAVFAPGRGSIFKQTYWPLATPDAALLAKWAAIRQVREAVNKAIEDVRSAGGVGCVAAGQRDGDRAARDPRAAGQPGRRPEVRVHHLGRHAAGGRGAGDRRGRRHRAQVRALLALPRRRGQRRGPPDDLRALRQQPARGRRSAHRGLTNLLPVRLP